MFIGPARRVSAEMYREKLLHKSLPTTPFTPTALPLIKHAMALEAIEMHNRLCFLSVVLSAKTSITRCTFFQTRKEAHKHKLVVRLALGRPRVCPRDKPRCSTYLHSGSPVRPRDKPSFSMGQPGTIQFFWVQDYQKS